MKRTDISRAFAAVGIWIFLAIPVRAQIEGGRSLTFSNITGGFGARAMALGGAFIAIADDITAINYNPAGLAQLMRPEISAGGIFGGQTVKIPWADESPRSSYYHYYYSSSAEIKASGFDFSYAGLVVPFRIGRVSIAAGFAHQVKGAIINADYDYFYVNSVGWTSGETVFHTEEFHTMYVSRTGTTSAETISLAIRPLEFLHLGFNLNIWKGAETNINSRHSEYFHYAEGVPYGSLPRVYENRTTYRISRGISYDVGLLLKLKAVSLGLVYKYPFHADYAYDWSMSDVWDGELVMSDQLSLSGNLFWPSSFGAGIAARPLDLLTLCVDYTSTQWSSSFIDRGKGFAPLDYPIDNPRNSRQIRAGLEYLLAAGHSTVPVRAGWFSDRLYWNDVEGEPVDFMGVTVGAGLALGNIILDLSAIYHFGSFLGGEYDLAKTRQSSWEILGSLTLRLGR